MSAQPKGSAQEADRIESQSALLVKTTAQLDTITLIDQSQKATNPNSLTWAGFMASPRAVMVLVPLLVLVLGVTLTVIGQVALSATSKTMAKERFIEQTATSTLRVESALAQADPLLLELENLARQAHSGQIEFTQLASQMRDLLLGRRAISQVYVAFPDGSFWGVGPGPNGELEFQSTTRSTSISYAILSGRLVEKSTRSSSFDPTNRAWYIKAKKEKSAVWSNPYVFFSNHHPGITRASPFYEDKSSRHFLGVVGVDFDVQALTAFMAAGESGKERARSLVFSADGVVLAYPYGAQKIAALPRTNQVITHQLLADSELSALITSIIQLPVAKRSVELHRFSAGRTKMLASVRRVEDDGPEWYVASFADEQSILRELHDHRAQSLWIGGLALALAVLMGWWLASYILRVKHQITQARAAAEFAQEQVRDLGSYRLISLLGEGGMGEVWRARHRLLAREAAIKLIKIGPLSESRRDEQRERFRREAQAISGLRSRNTVALFDYGATPTGTLFYVMELLDGIDLSRLVTRHGPQPPERVREILLQACNSLSEAHEAGLIHRDIKPANMFLCREADEVDIVKVLDFGLVFQAPLPPGSEDFEEAAEATGPSAERILELLSHRTASYDPAGRITNPDHQLGTPAFMSPEQALGNAITRQTDLYSLGCVAWWLLTGEPPFSAESQMGLLVQHIDAKVPDLQALVPRLSANFCAIITDCLHKSPEERPVSARALAERLRSVEVGGAAWTRTDAEEWWQIHRPKAEDLKPNSSLIPLRDAEIRHPGAT